MKNILLSIKLFVYKILGITIESKQVDNKIKLRQNSEFELEVLLLLNGYRKSKNLSEFIIHDSINFYCYEYNRYLIDNHKIISHYGVVERLERLNQIIDANSSAENLAFNFDNPIEVVDAWIRSKSHNAILLAPHYTHVGISVEENEKGKKYYTNFFASINNTK